jgi:2-polyprenyl-6-methoxyphenol hydroxylase-like FAD-dependent oxidoreductase
MRKVEQFDVIISGAGPVGLSLAINLGRLGTRCLLVERNPTTAPWPKMDRANARTMELFRRIGLADAIRKLGYPPEIPMDVFLMTRLAEPPVAILQFDSVAQARRKIAAAHDGSLPLEPYQLVSQNKVEPLLKRVAEETPNVAVVYGCELISFEQHVDHVAVTCREVDGGERLFSASYLVGCDGASSSVRKALGIKLEGQGGIREATQVIFYSEDLFDKIPYGKGRHYSFLDPAGSGLVAQGDRKEFTLHTSLPPATDFVPVIRDLVGFECDLKIMHVVTWRHHLLLAERFRDRRVFLAGDSAHLVIPTGGLGMNTGVGDAFDLAWKLAGVVAGWGGDGLLASYEAERRKVAARNIEASGWAASGVPIWQALVTPAARDKTERGADLRHEIAKSFVINHGRMHGMRGAEMGYSYSGSQIVSGGCDAEPNWDINTYIPIARPGYRAPSMWCRDGTALQDKLAEGYTLLCFDRGGITSSIEEAFAGRGAPLSVLVLDEPHMRGVYDKRFFLLRPDLHIAWHGDAIPEKVEELTRIVTGQRRTG